MQTVYINSSIHFTLEKIEKIEVMKANKLIKLHLRRFAKKKINLNAVTQSHNLIRFYCDTDKKAMKRNKLLS